MPYLSASFPPEVRVPNPVIEGIVEIPIAVIERGFYQPREYFDAEAMAATLQSIREKGQKYPVILRPIVSGNPLFDPAWTETHYELADGERRYRCCKELGFSHLKALVRDLTDEEMLDHTLTTNDSLPLNPIEKAMVFSRLAKEFGKSQAEVAKSFNLKQQQVSEYIRLLELPKEIQDLTARAVISVRHARELLKISDHDKMAALAAEVQNKALSTRELTKKLKESKKSAENVQDKVKTSDIIFDSNLKSSENGIKTLKNAENLDDEQASGAMEEVKAILQAQVQREHRRTWLEKAHFRLIPGKYYQKMDYWLSFELGSTLRPEQWIQKVEIACVLGLAALILAYWLPLWILAAMLGFLFALISFLYLLCRASRAAHRRRAVARAGCESYPR